MKTKNIKKGTHCGIYIIKNLRTNQKYCGSSYHIVRRLLDHSTKLKHNKHKNIKLQTAYNLYGENNFEFNVIEYCEDVTLQQEREQWYLDNIINWGKDYNNAKVAVIHRVSMYNFKKDKNKYFFIILKYLQQDLSIPNFCNLENVCCGTFRRFLRDFCIEYNIDLRYRTKGKTNQKGKFKERNKKWLNLFLNTPDLSINSFLEEYPYIVKKALYRSFKEHCKENNLNYRESLKLRKFRQIYGKEFKNREELIQIFKKEKTHVIEFCKKYNLKCNTFRSMLHRHERGFFN